MKCDVYNFSDKSLVGFVDIDLFSEDTLKMWTSHKYDRFLSMHLVRAKAAHLSRRNAKTRNQSEVSGTTRKPFNQKGGGRARQGTKRAAQHVGGATMFGPRGLERTISIPHREVRLAKRILLAKAIKMGKFFVVDDIAIPDNKTKSSIACFSNFTNPLIIKALVLHSGDLNKNNYLSSRNLRGVRYACVKDFTTRDIIASDVVIVSKSAVMDLLVCLK